MILIHIFLYTPKAISPSVVSIDFSFGGINESMQIMVKPPFGFKNVKTL